MNDAQTATAHVIGSLEALGVETDEIDAAVIAAAIEQFRPGQERLLSVDLSDVAIELDFDPSRPPT
jgi:hypothetical protein